MYLRRGGGIGFAHAPSDVDVHVEVPLRAFFNGPTVANLAAAVERRAVERREGGS